jgi:hypothetical protein
MSLKTEQPEVGRRKLEVRSFPHMLVRPSDEETVRAPLEEVGVLECFENQIACRLIDAGKP